ncbi:MAG TPA: glycosyl hydrolase family 28-related protein [Terriglobales bacterium]|jgi:sugar lactone lactonase YvrE|nr:glycosyl hydrolase family 28-related protein [Terriglobales bacterium]
MNPTARNSLLALVMKGIFVSLLFSVNPLFAISYYAARLDDSKAIYFTPDNFAVKGDGVADDSAALQEAINKVQEKTNQGILFIPSGRYRVTKTIYIWPGIRLIGFGTTRPLLLLAANTAGFQHVPTYMVFFAGRRPSAGGTVPDASPGTFYSAISNIDFDIQDGNPGAVGVRAHYAQHCFLAHIDFHIGSGLAGIHDGGNVAQDVHFYGGQYGIWTRKPSPGWQFTIIDATFEGQREAAIREHEAGLTLIRPQFKNVPTAISIDPHYSDELWIKDGRMENVSGPAVVISNEKNARTEINMENVACANVPLFASYRDSGRFVSGPAKIYEVQTFSHGLHYEDMGVVPAIEDVFTTTTLNALPKPIPSDILDLPPIETWVNIRTLGAAGDGVTDDTEALRKAIAQHRAIYFPSGQYRVTDTVSLRTDTVLIGLQPSVTRILLADSTPAFQGIGSPKPLLETPRGGTNIVTGIGLYTNGVNPRAVAAKWAAGKDSMMNDVRFLGGHGTVDPNASAEESAKGWKLIYNDTHTADPDPRRRWDSQYPSLWITGGGTFLDIWTPSTFAQAGLLISNTSTEGRIYQLSSEHHVRNEVILDHASNWQIYALQTEEERGESGLALPLDIRDSSNITFANLHMYRVVSSYQPFPTAVTVRNSRDISFRNLHCYSDSKVSFDNSLVDQGNNIELRQREFAWLTISGHTPQKHATDSSPILEQDAKVEKLAGGFFNISGGAVDRSGDVYFVDAQRQTIYRWSVASRQLSKVRDNPLRPVQLFFDNAGDLIVISYDGDGTVYSFRPGAPDDNITLLKAVPTAPRPGMTPVLAVDYWRNENDFLTAISAPKPFQFVSPDGSTFFPAGADFVTGELYYGSKLNDALRTFGLAPAISGKPFYVSDESVEKTYVGSVGDDGSITNLRLFAEQGGEGLAVDDKGNVYIAAGQVLVYSPSGDLIDTIEIPERPSQLLFGGADGRSLFVLARSSLYVVRTVIEGPKAAHQ